MIQAPLVFYDVSTFFVAKLGGEGDVGCKTSILAIAPVGVHAVRSLFEREVAENACCPEETTVWVFDTYPFRVQMF